jgi:phosphate transport system permease protein
MTGLAFLAIAVLLVVGFALGRIRASALQKRGAPLHSRPAYHGFFVAIWAGIPAFVLLLLWLLLQERLIDAFLLTSLPEARLGELSPAERNLLISEIRQVAEGRVFREPSAAVQAAAERLRSWRQIAEWAALVAVLAVALVGLGLAASRIGPAFRARVQVERSMTAFMLFCSLVAILTTLGIIGSLAYEASLFFARVPAAEFFFGLRWEPQIPIREGQVAGAGAFGAVPVFMGTLLISGIALGVAIPIGLYAAIYLREFAGNRFRAVIKPLLEILAGIPTVVYGFFAVLVVAPAVRQFAAQLGIGMSPNAALIAGGVMGIMLIPFISSLSDDAINAVPRAMRDGSLALGATKGETIRRVLLPSALPGIMGGILLAASRAIGETMIVVMAAGLIATLTVNPLNSVTTVTVQIVTLLIGDTEFDNPKTLAAFALGLVLFVATLLINIVALRIVQKYREAYE